MQHLTIKNLVLSFLALNLFSAIALHSQVKTLGSVSAPHEAGRPAKAKPASPDLRPEQPVIVKVLDLPDSETLRFSETTFVDLGWRQTDQNGGEWVGHVGSDKEYLPLNAEQITGMLKEAQLKSLPPPPASHVETPRKPGNEPVTAPFTAEGIDLAVSEALRDVEKTFADPGRDPVAGKDGERFGTIGSDPENLSLSADHIAGRLQDDLQPLALPLPPAPPAVTPRDEPATAPPAPEGIDLLDFIPVLLGIVLMMYIRYRITQMTLDAAQGAVGTLQRALSQLISGAKTTVPATPAAHKPVTGRAPAPIGVTTPLTKHPRTSTVVRPAPGLFSILTGAR